MNPIQDHGCILIVDDAPVVSGMDDLRGVLAMSEIAVVSSRKSRLQKLADDDSPGAQSALAPQSGR